MISRDEAADSIVVTVVVRLVGIRRKENVFFYRINPNFSKYHKCENQVVFASMTENKCLLEFHA